MTTFQELALIAFEPEKGGIWSAQCLQYDIAVQADSLHALKAEFERTLRGHLIVSQQLGREPFAGLSPAPPEFWESFNKADMQVSGAKKPAFRTPQGIFGFPETDLKLAMAY